MSDEFERIFQVSEKRLARLAYTVWDIIKHPKSVNFYNLGSSFRFSYDLHTTLFGEPNNEILERYNPKGEISLSFDLKWLQLVKDYFSHFKVMDKSAENQDMNKFLCMELAESNFISKDTCESQKISENTAELLSFKQRMLYSNSDGGGVIITKNGKIIAVAFAPHIIKNERFSFAIIRGVWVSKEHRNKGYGYDVSTKICQELFLKNIDKITLWVEETNIPAVKIYEKMGFKTMDKVFGTDCIKNN